MKVVDTNHDIDSRSVALYIWFAICLLVPVLSLIFHNSSSLIIIPCLCWVCWFLISICFSSLLVFHIFYSITVRLPIIIIILYNCQQCFILSCVLLGLTLSWDDSRTRTLPSLLVPPPYAPPLPLTGHCNEREHPFSDTMADWTRRGSGEWVKHTPLLQR